jgi:hypothetical protein
MTDLALRCRCGEVRGTVVDVAPGACNHALCYCKDCQAFARFLDRADMLDAYGGTDIVQVAPSQVRIERGAEQLRSVRLHDKGMIRWYSACCRSPLGNTMSMRVPFVGLPTVCFEPRPTDAVIGNAVGANAKSATSPPPGEAYQVISIRWMLGATRRMLGWWLRGKGKPTPYFVERTGEPRSAPTVLTAEERTRFGANAH